MNEQIEALVSEAKKQLFSYPKLSKEEQIKRVIKKIIRPGSAQRREAFFWQHALLTQALEEAGETKSLKKFYESWLNKGLPVYHLDGVMNGYSLLYYYEQSRDEHMLEAAEALFRYLGRYQTEMGGILPYRKQHPTHIYVDGVGMITPFLARYSQVGEKKEAACLAADQINHFLELGMDKATGLPYHGYDTQTKEQMGILGWGRAVGWLMLALADSLEFLPANLDKMRLTEAFQRLVKAVIQWQREDGYFSWQIQALNSPKDSSATAMIAHAVCKGKEIGALLEDYEQELEKMEKAILTSVREGKIYDSSGECEGFSQYPQIYGAYPWSLGPGLRFLLERQK